MVEKCSIGILWKWRQSADWDGFSVPWTIASGASGKYVSFKADNQ